MGRKQNRRLHRFGHDKLFHMLRYKARAMGILAIDAEESNTSKKSFAANEALPVHPDALARAGKAPAPASTSTPIEATASGRAISGAQNPEKPGLSPASLLNPPSIQRPTTEGCPPARNAFESGREAKPRPLGKRGQGKSRHRYATPSASAGWRVLHSDVNGGYNILRKACPAFRWSEDLSPRHELWWLSPWKGLAPMRKKEARAPA